MMTKNSEAVAKPTNQKEIVLPLKQEIKPQRYRYVEKEEPESSSISSYARGRINSVPQVE